MFQYVQANLHSSVEAHGVDVFSGIDEGDDVSRRLRWRRVIPLARGFYRPSPRDSDERPSTVDAELIGILTRAVDNMTVLAYINH